MRGKTTWGVAGLVLGLALALSAPSFGQSTPPSNGDGEHARTVAVTGSATIRTAPDEAVITLGVQTEAETAEAAMRENAARLTDVIAALLDAGVREEDVATAWVSLYPRTSSDGVAVIGYTADNSVNVTIRDMGRIGRVIDRAVAAGANLSSGISFQLSDESRGVEQALADAVGDARSKAQALADAGDDSLGAIVSVSETGGYVQPPVYYDDRMYAGAEAAAPTPISPPTLESQVTVAVTWQLV
jgi:uncharacterized protein YggE